MTTVTSVTYPLHLGRISSSSRGVSLVGLLRRSNEALGEAESSLSKIEFLGFKISDGRK
jgi:hypothetical protein